ncbi:DUF2470 domain-containing protein [Ruicaihuangia caeni]|uniref:DUF2470 domain-containing protein n=1 Tax=Ruicaihuangia caeni TaxID=3042517 RepID=A0AAW6T5E1_9MICO|nr:DUF2470 domain-containing protein [Klugiella sp. YN-L-19]MDI2099051.1 DUF2470 domain-containing protein [Klugiella sp. YN-L-19]
MPVFSDDVVAAVLHHMNDDHTDDNLLIARAFGDADAAEAVMTTLDEHGGTWRYTSAGQDRELNVPWPGGAIAERRDIRREVVALYESACERLGVPRREQH